MNKDCSCNYCKNEVDEFFCASCFHNFNKCESFHEHQGITLCPECHPEDDIIIEVVKILEE